MNFFKLIFYIILNYFDILKLKFNFKKLIYNLNNHKIYNLKIWYMVGSSHKFDRLIFLKIILFYIKNQLLMYELSYKWT